MGTNKKALKNSFLHFFFALSDHLSILVANILFDSHGGQGYTEQKGSNSNQPIQGRELLIA